MSASVAASPPARPTDDASLVRRVRWRLLAWSGGTTLVVLVTLGTLLYLAVASSLAAAGEAQLRARANLISAGIAQPFTVPVPGPGDAIVDQPTSQGLVIGGPTSGTFAYVVGPSFGEMIGRSSRAPTSSIPRGAPTIIEDLALPITNELEKARQGTASLISIDVAGRPMRLLSMPVPGPDGQVVIQVLGDRTAEIQALNVLLIVLGVGGVLVLAASLAVGWVYAERALVPIRDALRRQREFAADASHEFRTPLAVLRGSVEDLRRNADQPVVQVGHALDDMEGEVDRLTAMVDHLLLLARTDSGVIEIATEPTDLAEVALDASGGLLAAAGTRAVRIEVDAEPVPLMADPARLRQLVTIIVDNAVRHAPAGSTVEVGVTAVDGSGRLRVDDRGPGFRPDDLPRVFDRFWRASDAPPDGTGLGLSIANWIAERHGGSISASNRPDGGARLEVLLPLS